MFFFLSLSPDYPRVLDMPARVYLPRGMTGRIECPVESNPPLTVILWNRDNVGIDYTQSRHMRASNEGTLVIKPVISSDEGQYTCVPYSPLGRGEASWPVQVLVRGWFRCRTHAGFRDFDFWLAPAFVFFRFLSYARRPPPPR